MKLHSVKIPLRDHGWVSRAVVSLAHNHITFRRLAEIGMHEIEKRLVVYPIKQKMSNPLSNLIPTNLRYDQIVGKAANPAGQESKAGRCPKLFRVLEEHLHADADAEQ